MNLRERYRSWRSEKIDQYDWIAYRLFHIISDPISDNTGYGSVLKSAGIDVPVRLYTSRILLNAVIIWILLSVIANLFAIPESWISAFYSSAEFILSITSIPIILESIGSQVISIFKSVLSVGSEIQISVLIQGLEESVRSIGRSIRIIGAILLAFATAFETLFLPIIDIFQEVVSQFPDIERGGSGSGSINPDAIINTVLSYIPPRSQIRTFTMVVVAPITAILYMSFKIGWPTYISSERGREIDNNLARSYTFMHALSEGGLGIYEVMGKLAESEDAYGEVSRSFQKIVRNSNKAGGSLSSAISDAADETPSEELKEFLNGLTNSIDTGSDINAYIQSRAQRALEDAREAQEGRLSIYELISEGYIIIFVAAPVFFIILQLVKAMTGSVNKDTAQIVPYIIIPVGGFMISAIIYMTGKQDQPSYKPLDPTRTSKWYDIEVHRDLGKKYHSKAQRISRYVRRVKSSAVSPLIKLKYNPKLSMAITIPIAIIVIATGIQLGFIPTSGLSAQEATQIDGISGEVSLMDRIDEQHLESTIFAIYLPFIIIALPWSILYEIKRREREKVLSQLPQLFSSIAGANRRGLTLQESIESTAMSSDSKLYNELQKAIRTSEFTRDINGSLINFANQVRVPRLSQSIRLLVEANRVSSNVTAVVDKIANDLESKYALYRDRKQRARIYVVIIFVAFFIGSAVLIALDVTFFSFIAEEIGATSGGGSSTRGPSYGQDLPIQFFRRVFLHTLLALAFVSGTVAGMMENGVPANGLKYSIIMATLALLGFIIVPEIV